MPRADPAVLARTVACHVALTAGVVVLISTLFTIGVTQLARSEAYRSAERVGKQVAAGVLVPLSHHDFTRPVGPVRTELRSELAAFLTSDMVRRVKVWTVHGDNARIAFSDQPGLEGEASRTDAETTRRLATGQLMIHTVPHNFEHRYESWAADSLLEVFIGFHDAGGNTARLEVYVPIDESGTARHTESAILPMMLAGVILLAAATMPLSVAVARRMERERAQQRAVRRYGLAAAESSRRELAQHLHNEVIPELAGARLLLQAARGEDPDAASSTSSELIEHAHDLLTGEMRQLRGLLDDLVPAVPVHEDIRSALHELVTQLRARHPGDAPVVRVAVAVEKQTPDASVVVLYQVARELLRNVFHHACAHHVSIRLASIPNGGVELTVSDDGIGFDPESARRTGHVGLLLVRRVLDDHFGHLDINSGPGIGTAVTAGLPPS